MYDVLWNNKELFYTEGSLEIGCTSKVKHEINTGDAQPVRKNPYRLDHALKPVIEGQVNDMLKKGIIVESSSPWNSPILMVRKKSKDGSAKFRLCVYLRGVNVLTKPDAYPLPNIVDTLDSLGQSKVFSVLDMASGYLQIEIAEKDREKTAFSTPQGHFHYNRMCFGLMNAPATYQRCMDSILMGLRGVYCLCYIDDLLIFSKDIASHAMKLQKVFDRLKDTNFKIQANKCQFAVDTVEYLCHIVTSEGIKPDPSKVVAIQTVRDIRSFVGLASYYRRHVSKFAAIAQPLTKLTRKNKKFVWEIEQEQAFAKLKYILSTEPLLIYPDFTQPS